VYGSACTRALSHLHCRTFYVTNDASIVSVRIGDLRMSDNGGFRAHHKYMIAAVGVIAVLAFLYNFGIFDVWSVGQIAK
jgi:hypothetical protein